MQIIQLDFNNWFLCNMNLKAANNFLDDYVLLNSVKRSGTVAENIKFRVLFVRVEFIAIYLRNIICK
jgi:hypothetical protein